MLFLQDFSVHFLFLHLAFQRGTKCLSWLTKSGSQGSSYSQSVREPSPGKRLLRRKSSTKHAREIVSLPQSMHEKFDFFRTTWEAVLTCKKTSTSNNRQICVQDHAQLETTTAEATTRSAPRPPCRTTSTPNGLAGRSCHFPFRFQHIASSSPYKTFHTSWDWICSFPFRFQGITYTHCTTAGGYSREWCPTAYNAYESYHATGHWGYCGSSCDGATV